MTFGEKVKAERTKLGLQKALAVGAVWLLDGILLDEAPLVQVQEELLDNLGLLRIGSPSEVVEVYAEPLVDFGVDGVVVVAELPWTLLFLQGPCFGGGTILIGTTNIHGIVATAATESGEDIC